MDKIERFAPFFVPDNEIDSFLQKNYRLSMGKSKFFENVRTSAEEREVEDVYNNELARYYRYIPITHPFKCDGYIETLFTKLIIEYKFDEDFKLPTVKAKVLVQVLFYLKRFEQDGRELPNVILVGDKNECFVLHSNDLINYLDADVKDWDVAPSRAHEIYPDLVLKIAQDTKINPFVYDITSDFNFAEVVEKISNLAENVQRYIRVTEHNMSNNFESFCSKVIKKSDKIAPNELVAIYIGIFADKLHYYRHPENPNLLVANGKHIDIDGRNFDAFFSNFDRTYTPQELNRFAEISDRLIEDTKRRRSGEFYTPTPFVDYAHQMLTEQLGEDWRERYVVWDCCWGTGNLTRDYKFKELYASTLEQAELDIAERYNREATKFQFDFLNDSIDDLFGKHVPEGLLQAFKENKPILFFINPPYGTACNQGETSKEGINNTEIRKEMHEDALGAGAENIQHQFLYRICKLKNTFQLTNICIGIFSKPIYLSGEKQKEFLTFLCKNFEYKTGILFQASEFADVSGAWGITFNIWRNGETISRHEFGHSLAYNQNNAITINGSKNIYNVWDKQLASEWVRENNKAYKFKSELPCVNGAIHLKEVERPPLTHIESIGYMHNNANSVQFNAKYVGLYSTPFASAHGLPIMKDNYLRCVALFSARKLVEGNWINDKDEYLAPNEQHEKWQEFINDSIVFSLFHSSSNQSSLRQVEYKGKLWDIKNEFFWLPKAKIMELAEQNNLVETYEDARTADERFVYKKLQGIALSPEAQAVLDKATELTRKSFQYRALFNQEHPEYQILNWDCGWYQIKGLLNAYMPAELKEFTALFKQLADKMRPMVYELGFLK